MKYVVTLNDSKYCKYFGSEETIGAFLSTVNSQEVKAIYVENESGGFDKISETNFTFSENATCKIDGNTYPISEMKYLSGFGFVHNSNLDKLVKCAHCGKYEFKENLKKVEGRNEYVCDRCISNGYYAVCEDCGKVYPYSGEYIRSISGHGMVCMNCLEESDDYMKCPDCGDWYLRGYMNEHINGLWYCDDCYRSRNNFIQDYHHTRDLPFIKADGEDTNRYFGIELEIGGAGREQSMAKFAIEEIKNLECKSDSSIERGFEMVTFPMTYKHLMSIRDKWENVLDKAKSMKYKSDGSVNCGMHIHVSRNSLTEPQIDRICQIFEGFWNNIFVFSRRNEENLNWCRRYWENGYGKLGKKKLKEKINDIGHDRYRAVNLTNSPTIEFRIFNGTLDLETFYANIQFANRICDIVTTYSEDDFNNLTWKEIINGDAQYEDLISYGNAHLGNNADTPIGTVFEVEAFVPRPKRTYPNHVKRLTDELLAKLSANPNVWKSLPIGTKVRICSYLSDHSVRGITITDSMIRLQDELFVITDVIPSDDVFDVRYKLNGSDELWTIDMFDQFCLPNNAIVTASNAKSLENVPLGYCYDMAGERKIRGSDYRRSDDYYIYNTNRSGSYNNWMFASLALLNMAIFNGASYDNLSWV